MSAKEILKTMEELHYWDTRIKTLSCNHFADEIEIIYDFHSDEENYAVKYQFLGCYKSSFEHLMNDDKCMPVKDMTPAQIPYYLQQIDLDEKFVDNVKFYRCKINMFPMDIEIWCKDIIVTKCENEVAVLHE